MRSVFGTDGIRSEANIYPMTPDNVLRVGMAAGLYFGRDSDEEHRLKVVIGKDTRLSGYMYERAISSGFLAVGADVFELGPVPTPAVAMLVRSYNADVGVMISASHNPYGDNGIKLFGREGYKLSVKAENEINELLKSDIMSRLVEHNKIGRAKRIDGVLDRYIEAAKRTLPRNMSFEGLRVILDCAHGAAYKVAPMALRELSAEVFTIGVDPDGFNINDGVGSTRPGLLKAKVKEMRANLGIALDGDADRFLLVDEMGKVIDGDQVLAAVVSYLREQDRLIGDGVVGTVMSGLGLERHINGLGLNFHRTQVGDRHISEKMRELKINVGGEPSGHIILSDFATTGDGLVVALQVLALRKSKGRSVSELCQPFHPVPQILKNISIMKGRTPLEDSCVKEAIGAGSKTLDGSGRLIVRPSGTEPVIRIMAEGDNQSTLEEIVSSIEEAINLAKV